MSSTVGGVSVTDIDDDDWVDLEKPVRAGGMLPDVSVRISIAEYKDRKSGPRAYIAFRRDGAKWIVANAPRFRIQVGGAMANKIRIVPDVRGGRFENSTAGRASKEETQRIILGGVSIWPAEARDPTAAQWKVDDGAMILTLPPDFARPRVAPKAALPTLVAPARPSPVAPTAKPLERGAPVSFGQPAAGRSALDQRRIK